MLMCLNFLMESIKWKVVVANTNPISFTKAIKSVLVGQAFAFFTPNRIGDFAGRVLFLKTEHKLYTNIYDHKDFNKLILKLIMYYTTTSQNIVDITEYTSTL